VEQETAFRMAASRYLTSAWRTFSSVFTLDPTGEKFAFARFRGGGGDEVAAAGGEGGPGRRSSAGVVDHGATELTEIQSNGAAAQRKKDGDSDKDKDGGEFYPTEEHVYNGSESKSDRNQISAWQAGWNVTNAIQVK